MTVKRKAVEENMFADNRMKAVRVDMDNLRAGQLVADMAYHGSPCHQRMMVQQHQMQQMQVRTRWRERETV